MSDLLPCPFCGGEAHHGHHNAYSVDSSFDFIGCKDCDCMFEYEEPKWNARTQSLDHSSRDEAIAAWNRRAEAAEAERDALRAKVARLEGVADFARLIGNDAGKDDKDTVLVSYGMLRRLRAAMNDGDKEKP